MTRDERIERNLDLPRLHAVRIWHHIGRRMPLDDLVQYGMLGLIQASDRFDETRGLNFRTLANHKVKGAIVDGIRRETKCGNGKHVPQPVSLDSLLEERKLAPVDPAPLPDAQTDLVLVWRLVARLPARMRCILLLCYGHNLTDLEIARRMRLTPRRIWQIRLEAIAKLRRKAGQ